MFYSHAMFGKADGDLEMFARRRYDVVLLCADDIPFEQDGTRQDEAFRRRQHAWYLERLAEMDQPWTLVGGTVDERVRRAVELLLD